MPSLLRSILAPPHDWCTAFALSCFNPGSGGGWLDIDSFTLAPLPATDHP